MPETVPSSAGGGRNAFYFARYLSARCAGATICCLNYNKKLKAEEFSNGVRIHRAAYFNKTILHKAISFPWLLIKYLQFIALNHIIILYGNYMPAWQIIIVFGRLLRRKVVFRSTLLGDDDIFAIKEKSGFFWPLTRLILRQANLYFAINQAFESKWKAVFGNRVPMLVTVQGIDNAMYNKGLRDMQPVRKTRKLVFLSCGMLIERKGYRHIFNALSRLDIDFKYIVAGQYIPDKWHNGTKGERAEMDELYNKGIELLGNKIEFAGHTENIDQYYKLADIFIHGAFSEGTPNSVLEAMAAGMPVLVRELAGLSGVFVQGFNVEVYKTESELTERINYLANNPAYCLQLAHNAAATIEKNYTFGNIAAQISEKLYGG